MPTKVIEKNVRSFALLSVLTVLAAACVWSVWFQKSVLDKSASMAAEIQEQSRRFDQFAVAMDAIIDEQQMQGARIQAMEPGQGEQSAAALDLIIDEQAMQGARIQAVESAAESQRAQIGRIADIERAVTEQRDILRAALGHVLPMRMSSAWEERLAALENEASNPESWPADTRQSEEFIGELAELISELSPLAEETYFPRLAPLRWTAIGFEAMYRQPGEDETFFSIAEQLRAISDAKPPGMDSNLDQRLQQQADEHENHAQEQAIDEMLQQARRYLDSSKTEAGDASPLYEVYDALGIYADHPARKDEIDSARNELENQILTREAGELAGTLRENWNTVKRLGEENAAAYESAATMLLNEILVARSDAALQGIGTSGYDAFAREVEMAVDAIQDRRRRGYQEWALRQVMDFEVARTMIEDRPRGESESDEDDGLFCRLLSERFCGEWTMEKYREIQEAMVTYLLPVDQALLDLPVLNRYRREFQAGWELLAEQPAQTCVAIASAMVRKRTMHDLAALGAHDANRESVEDNALWETENCDR